MDSTHYISLAGWNSGSEHIGFELRHLLTLWVPSPSLYVFMNTPHTHFHCLPSLQWGIFVYYFLLCVCVCMWVCASHSIQKSEDSLWEATVSFHHVHPDDHSQDRLSTEPSHWAQLLFICLLVIWIFKREWCTSFGVWIMYFFLDTGFWKKAWFSLIKSVRETAGGKPSYGQEAEVCSVRKLRVLRCLVCHRKGSNRDFD